METPKCKHNVTLDSECADCVEIKTDSTNEFGLDYQYFYDKLSPIIRDIINYRPHELAREFARLSVTADSDVIHEDEFENPAIKTDNSQVLINQDKLIEKLQLKLDEQIAYSEKVRAVAINASKYLCEWDSHDKEHFRVINLLNDSINQSPAQSLNKLKAEAIRELYDWCVATYGYTKEVSWLGNQIAQANQILKGE